MNSAGDSSQANINDEPLDRDLDVFLGASLDEREGKSYQPPPVEILDDKEFTVQSKARFRRRLEERWRCKISGHTFCFIKGDGAHHHVPLSGEVLEIWVVALHEGMATLLVPPDTTKIDKSDVTPDATETFSLLTSTSVTIAEYQRPFRWRLNTNLTELRSARNQIQESSRATSSDMTSSTTSYFVPGIGSVSGKAVRWVGSQILSSISSIEIRRRRWLIQKLITKIERLPTPERAKVMLENQTQLKRAIDDLIELSSESYRAKYRSKAIIQGAVLRKILYSSPLVEIPSAAKASLYSMCLQTLPMHLLFYDSCSKDFVRDLREVLLQDRDDPGDEEWMVAELAGQLCFELAYSSPSSWHHEGYLALFLIYQTTIGRTSLLRLGRSGTSIQDLAKKVFRDDSPIQQNNNEYARALDFFALYANDESSFRVYVLGNTGMSLLGQKIKSVDKCMGSMCKVLSNLSLYRWCIPALVELNICDILSRIIITSTRRVGTGQFDRTWLAICAIRTLRNLSAFGGNSGKQAVQHITTATLLRTLRDVDMMVRRDHGDARASKVHAWATETWSDVEWQR